MSFSSGVKNELCSVKMDRKCCAVAECYGILMYCNTFTPQQIKIITASSAFGARLPKLFKKAFNVEFDVIPTLLPPDNPKRKGIFSISDSEKIKKIFSAFGSEADDHFAHHVNFGVFENDCCPVSFVRGAFLAGGSVTDPEKSFHLELATSHHNVSREVNSILLDMNFSPKETTRSGNFLLYFKQADIIADFLTSIGAGTSAMDIITAKVEREMRNTVTRQINCDSANTDKTVAAAEIQLKAIKKYVKENGLSSLPDPLKDAALLRIANPEASLADLAQLSSPHVSKSCLSYRLKKIMSLAEDGQEQEK